MLLTFGKYLAKGYCLLLTVAAGGFIGANFATCIPVIADFFVNPRGKAARPQVTLLWTHWGWLVGAAFALIGAAVHGRRSAKRTGEPAHQRRRRRARLAGYPSPRGVLASAGVGAACCGLLGAMLGGTLLLLWFSLAYSPFSPGWDRSMAVERGRLFPRVRTQWLHTTKSPVALYAFFGPTVLGALGGAVIGGVGSARTKAQRKE